MNKLITSLGSVTIVDAPHGAMDNNIKLTNDEFVKFCSIHFNDTRQIFKTDYALFVLYQGFYIYTVLEGEKNVKKDE
jgi:hypothetical protein